MSITIRNTHDDLATLLHIAPELLQSDIAQRAWHAGLLEAKQEAMTRAKRLERWGRPLLVAVIGVSFLHVWESIAAIKPAFVSELALSNEFYHAAAAAFTVAIDLAALYVVAAAQTVALAGAKKDRWATWFFLLLTLLLNMAYITRHAPNLPAGVQEYMLPTLNIAFIILLPAFIPAAILAVEAATQRLIAARLKLLVEVRTLEQLTKTETMPASQPSIDPQPLMQPTSTPATPTNLDPVSSEERPAAALRLQLIESHKQEPERSADVDQQAITRTSRIYTCPHCSSELTFGELGAAHRRGYCKTCKQVEALANG